MLHTNCIFMLRNFNVKQSMPTQLFYAQGEFCASHPWEIIVATITLTACLATVDYHNSYLPLKLVQKDRAGCLYEVDVIVMTIIRCLAVLYTYYQFRNLHRIGSKFVLGITGLFAVFSSFVFTTTAVNLLQINVSDLKDTLFLFLLLIDLSKAGKLAQIAFSSAEHEVKTNIATGMAQLGPIITLDAVVETLVIGVGTLSGGYCLEKLSYIAWLSVIINYGIFMTFYPACLSLTFDVSRKTESCGGTKVRQYLMEDQKSNPIVQRVKIIMSIGLVVVHFLSRWSFKDYNIDAISTDEQSNLNQTSSSVLHSYLTTDHILILTLFLAIVASLFLFETDDEKKQVQKKVEALKPCCSTQPSLCPVKNSFSFDNQEKILSEDKEIQTMPTISVEMDMESPGEKEMRSLEECLDIYTSNLGAALLTDKEVIFLVKNKHIPPYQIEKAVDNPERGVRIRRKLVGVSGNFAEALYDIPYKNYDYSKVIGACCENVIGYVPVPVGIVGPMLLDGQFVYVPMATTEGCLIASTNRGSRALVASGIQSRLVADGMTRGPVVRFPSVSEASKAMSWMETLNNFTLIKESFDASSRYARLTKIHIRIAGRHLFIRFVAKTGDAMGMNMLSKGTECALKMMQGHFATMEILSLSGNFCTDKKPAAVNWIEGRGKSVVCEAIVSAKAVSSVLKTNVHALVDVNISKNMIGSAMAGSIGGFNAHAANLVTAVFIATGQDPAQNVGSSNCMTLMEPWGDNGEDLYISCTMPSIEIGTVGGGTVLPAQGACLEILGVKGGNPTCPGENANRLARIVCATVLAGELSLMAALTTGHLVKSHLKHNRSSAEIFASQQQASESASCSFLTP